MNIGPTAIRRWVTQYGAEENGQPGIGKRSLANNNASDNWKSRIVNFARTSTSKKRANHAEAKADITDYIVGFYNCKRLNSVLGNLPPAAYERKMAKNAPMVVSEIT